MGEGNFTSRYAEMQAWDGTPTKVYTFTDLGNVQISGLSSDGTNHIINIERDGFSSIDKGVYREISITFDANVRAETLTDGSNDRQLDVMRRTGNFAAYVSTNPNTKTDAPPMLDHKWELTRGAVTTSIEFTECDWEASIGESQGESTRVSYSLTCHGGYTVSAT